MSKFTELHNLSRHLVLNLEDLGHSVNKLVIAPYEEGPAISIRAFHERRKVFVDVSLAAMDPEQSFFRLELKDDDNLIASQYREVSRSAYFSAWLYHSLQEKD